MDIAKIRLDFSTYMLKLDELNKNLIQQIADSEVQLGEQQNHHTTTKELLLKTQIKLTKVTKENRQHREKLKRYQDNTKGIEKEWIAFTMYLKKFHNECTCQAKDTSLVQPSQIHWSTLADTTTDNLPSSSSRTSPKLSRSTRRSPNISRPLLLSPTVKISPKSGVSKLRRRKPASPKTVKRQCLSQSPRRDQGDVSVVLYAADTPDPDLSNGWDPDLRGGVVPGEKSVVSALAEAAEPNSDPSVCPNSPTFNLHELSQQDMMPDEEVSKKVDTPTTSGPRPPKKFNLLTECRPNVSISEELLGFSLPQPEPSSSTDGKAADKIDQDDVDFKIPSPRFKPSDSTTSSSSKVPTTKTDFKYVKVVRKKEERSKLAASTCPSCYRYYSACGLEDEEIAKQIGDVSRHRHLHGRQANTPPSFWDLTIDHAPMPEEPATQRKPRKNRYITRKDS